MSDYNSNSSNRGNRGKRRRGGKRRHQDAPYDSREPRGEFRAPKSNPPTGFQKFLSVISFGLLGKKATLSKAYGAPQPIRTPREPGSAASGQSRT